MSDQQQRGSILVEWIPVDCAVVYPFYQEGRFIYFWWDGIYLHRHARYRHHKNLTKLLADDSESQYGLAAEWFIFVAYSFQWDDEESAQHVNQTDAFIKGLRTFGLSLMTGVSFSSAPSRLMTQEVWCQQHPVGKAFNHVGSVDTCGQTGSESLGHMPQPRGMALSPNYLLTSCQLN